MDVVLRRYDPRVSSSLDSIRTLTSFGTVNEDARLFDAEDARLFDILDERRPGGSPKMEGLADSSKRDRGKAGKVHSH